MAAQSDEAVARWRSGTVPFVLVRPTRRQQATFAVDAVVTYVEEGYRAAMSALDKWACSHAGGTAVEQPE